MRPRLLDLFCGAGGAGMGYHRAGFDVVGVDIAPQPHYPFEFHQADALEYLIEHGHEFDAIHASPPCQAHSVARHIHGGEYADLIPQTRTWLLEVGKPWVIENVPGAPLVNPVTLCGLMFGLRVYRHRMFESNFFMLGVPHAQHPGGATTNSKSGYSAFDRGATHITIGGNNFRREDAIAALNGDCAWMTRPELAQAIPPAYTEWIGQQLMAVLR